MYKAIAVKRTQKPDRPYIPVVIHETGQGVRKMPIRGAAYATQEEAVARAQKTIDYILQARAR